MDHYEYPRNKREEKDYIQEHVSTESCIDDITVQVLLEDNILKDVAFVGTACTIATSSVSMMTELMKGKTLEEAQDLIHEFNNMLKMEAFDEEKLGELVALRNVSRQPHRINCADLSWRALQLIIVKEVSHE